MAADAGDNVVDLPSRYVAGTNSYHLTDLGNAERFIADHGNDVHYCDPWSKWLIWDGYRWQRDELCKAEDLAKTTVRRIPHKEAIGVVDDAARQAILKHAIASERAPRIRAILELARSEEGIPVRPDSLDREAWLLNLRNGTLDLTSLKLRKQRRADLLTKLAPVDYDPDAQAPRWQTFLDEIFDGDQELIRFVQRAAGYSLTGDTSAQVFFLLHGPGENGKSTLLETLAHLLGDYAQQAPPDTFLDKRYHGIPNDVARLQGARFVTAVETGETRRLDESLVKQMTGGDRITARFLRAEFFEFTPLFKVWFATNHKPTIRGTDHAIWRRIRLIPFHVTIGPEDRDDTLKQKLAQELPGILNWALQGLEDYGYGDKLDPPAAVVEATAEYRSEEDTLGAFIGERCRVDRNARAASADLYHAYTTWCAENGERLETQTRFGRALADRGYDSYSDGGRRYRVGLELQGPLDELVAEQESFDDEPGPT